MTTSGELFEQEFETWTPAQAKSFFRAGIVDDFFATNTGDDLWVLTLVVVGRHGRQTYVQLRTARELDVHKVRKSRRSTPPCAQLVRLVLTSGSSVSQGRRRLCRKEPPGLHRVREPLGFAGCCRMPTDQGFARQQAIMLATASGSPTKYIRGPRHHEQGFLEPVQRSAKFKWPAF
ncbi:hypothetical protein PQR11_19960 [Paraburkholderia strydomiana]|uniref:hypothetical protein n=1 Tax=Paraburkholderia strydomiana TaxID=1245417 RepID=UPI0038BC0E98